MVSNSFFSSIQRSNYAISCLAWAILSADWNSWKEARNLSIIMYRWNEIRVYLKQTLTSNWLVPRNWCIVCFQFCDEPFLIEVFKISRYRWRSTLIKLPAHQPIRKRDLLVWKLSWAFFWVLFQHQHYLQNYIDRGLDQELDWRFYKDVRKIEIVKYEQESIECMEYYLPHETFFSLSHP